MKLSYEVLSYLESVDMPWIKYWLLKRQEPDSFRLREYKEAILSDERVRALIDACLGWPQPLLTRHNDAKHPIHQMNLLLDLGLDGEDEPIRQIAEKILSGQNEAGALTSLLMIPTHFGGSGEPEMQWMLCDFPLLLHFLIRAGYGNDPRVQKAIAFLAECARENGWRCAGSVPKFRGPGKKEDYCPFATLITLEVFSLLPEYHGTNCVKAGIDAILSHWDERKERKIYLFGMGTDFCKLKYPCIWFDIVHVCRVLSRFAYARDLAAFGEMIDIIAQKQNPGGGFVPESIYMAYKGWDFGQKKEPSPTLSYAIWEIVQSISG